MNTPKTNPSVSGPNKLNGNHVKILIAMAHNGYTQRAIGERLGVCQKAVGYQLARLQQLKDDFSPADTMTDTMTRKTDIVMSDNNSIKGYLWQGKVYKSLDDISDSVTLGDEILTVTVTDRQVVGLVKLEGDTKNV